VYARYWLHGKGPAPAGNGPLHYNLQPLGYCGVDLTVTARPGTPPGRWFATAQIEAAGQVVEDSALLAIGQPGYPDRDVPPDRARAMREAADTALEGELDLSMISPTAVIRAGGGSAVEVLLRNRTGTGIHGEAQLISPHGSWPQTGPWTTGFTLAAGAETTLRFGIHVPAAARSGEQWWAIVKVMYFGRVQYSEPIEVTIR
jgi:alpha-mannosidase